MQVFIQINFTVTDIKVQLSFHKLAEWILMVSNADGNSITGSVVVIEKRLTSLDKDISG